MTRKSRSRSMPRWLAALLVGAATLAATPGLASASVDAEFLRQTVPRGLAPGEKGTVSIMMKNTGTTPWTRATGFHLGSQGPTQDSTLWGPGRIVLGPNEVVPPGGHKHFLFPITAPQTEGTYLFKWRMVEQGVAWFGDFSQGVDIEVRSPSDRPTPKVISQDTPIIDPAFWDPIEQNGIFFGTSATITRDPRTNQEKLFLIPQVVPVSLQQNGNALVGVVGNDFRVNNPSTGWSFPHCREDAMVFILPPRAVTTPLDQVPGLLDDESAIRPHPCEVRPDGLLGWHYSPGTLVDVVEPHLGSGVDFAFIAASKSPDAAVFSEAVLLVSDLNAPGVGATNKFRQWEEVPLFHFSQNMENQGYLIPEVLIAREEQAVWTDHNGHTQISWPGFAQLWRPDFAGTTPLQLNYNVDLDEWTTFFQTPDLQWHGFNNKTNPEVDLNPRLVGFGFPKDFVFNEKTSRWELWYSKGVSHDANNLPPGCALQEWPYQRNVGGQWVDHQRGSRGVTLGYRHVTFRGLALGNEIPLTSDFRAAAPDYETGRQGAGVLFLKDQIYLYTSHRDRNICELPSSPVLAGGECGYCGWFGLYTTVERLDYVN